MSIIRLREGAASFWEALSTSYPVRVAFIGGGAVRRKPTLEERREKRREKARADRALARAAIEVLREMDLL